MLYTTFIFVLFFDVFSEFFVVNGLEQDGFEFFYPVFVGKGD